MTSVTDQAPLTSFAGSPYIPLGWRRHQALHEEPVTVPLGRQAGERLPARILLVVVRNADEESSGH